MTEQEIEELKQQCKFFKDRMEAAEAKLSLIARGFKVTEEKKNG